MYGKFFFSLLVTTIPLVSMDVEPLSDATFLLWCGALTCKEIKREQVTNQTPRQFLRIDETHIQKEKFYVQRDELYYRGNDVTLSDEVVLTEPETGLRDRRLGGRWRILDGEKPKKAIWDQTQEERDTEIKLSLGMYGRQHASYSLHKYDTGCDCKDCEVEKEKGQAIQLYPNSIPYEKAYLYAGTCAHTDENLWVTTDPAELELHNKDHFPLRLLWVEQFKKPVLLYESMIPAKTYDIVRSSVAIKFLENGTQFQVYYDASEKRNESVIAGKWKSKNATVTVENYVEHRDQPSLWVLTYTLNRMKKYGAKMDSASLTRWYDVFQRMKINKLKDDELPNAKAEISAVLDQWEAANSYIV